MEIGREESTSSRLHVDVAVDRTYGALTSPSRDLRLTAFVGPARPRLKFRP